MVGNILPDFSNHWKKQRLPALRIVDIGRKRELVAEFIHLATAMLAGKPALRNGSAACFVAEFWKMMAATRTF
jgi:hypothetical protein